MSHKRFHDIDIWDLDWFVELTPAEKIAFIFIKDKCDNAGVWKPSFVLAERLIGAQIDWDKLIKKVNKNFVILENGKWWIPDFCRFQYNLNGNPTDKARISYKNLLIQHGLWNSYLNYLDEIAKKQGVSKGLGRGLIAALKGHRGTSKGPKEKEKEKDTKGLGRGLEWPEEDEV